MKKGLLGCLGVALVLIVVAGVAAYQFVYKPAKSYIGSFTEMAALSEYNEQIDNQASYDPPADGELSPSQVDRLLAVQTSLREHLGAEIEKLDAKYEHLNGNQSASPGEVIAAFRDLVGLFETAKATQVEALNAEDFSLDEYRWVQREAYRAAGVFVPQLDLSRIAQAAQDGSFDAETVAVDTSAVPAHNRTLVGPHAEQLEEMAALAFFGL